MAFFFSKKPRVRRMALLDVGSSSVGAALAALDVTGKPSIYYTVREVVEPRQQETLADAMLRTLESASKQLIERGAPILSRETGSGHLDTALVSVAAPWQETNVYTKTIERERPFTFTKSMLEQMADEAVSVPSERRESGRTVIATLLNGYEITHPFGKRVKRADAVILSSTIDEEVARSINRIIRRVFHRDMQLTAFAPAAYAVFRDMFPHERDFLVLAVSGEGSDLAFVKHSLLVSVATIPTGIAALLSAAQSVAPKAHIDLIGHQVIDPVRNQRFATNLSTVEEAWLGELVKTLETFTARHALPRTLFLVAEPVARGYLARLLDRPNLRSLWLSDEPLAIIPVEPKHMSTHVRTRAEAEADTALGILALYASRIS